MPRNDYTPIGDERPSNGASTPPSPHQSRRVPGSTPRVVIPQAFICCITSEIMSDPVVTNDGQTYERTAIERWLLDHNTSPRTNERLTSKVVVPNVALRQQIDDFCRTNALSPPRPYHPPPRVSRAPTLGTPLLVNGDALAQDPCPWMPGWVVAALFLAVWLSAWAAGEVTVAKEVIDALADGGFGFNAFFTVVWLVAWTFGGCVACSAMYGLALRECWPDADPGETEMGNLGANGAIGANGGNGGGGPPHVATHTTTTGSMGTGGHRGEPSASGTGPSRGSGNVAMSEAQPLTGTGRSAAPATLAGVV